MALPHVHTVGATEGPVTGAVQEPDRLDSIAIIGIGCRFPGGIEDPRSFWELIASGTDTIVDIPPDRWRADAFFDSYPGTPGRMVVRQGGFLSSPVDRFDAGFFGMTPREAAALDPQQRLLLEVTWEAFEDAGLPPSRTAAANVGCYIGGVLGQSHERAPPPRTPALTPLQVPHCPRPDRARNGVRKHLPARPPVLSAQPSPSPPVCEPPVPAPGPSRPAGFVPTPARRPGTRTPSTPTSAQ